VCKQNYDSALMFLPKLGEKVSGIGGKNTWGAVSSLESTTGGCLTAPEKKKVSEKQGGKNHWEKEHLGNDVF